MSEILLTGGIGDLICLDACWTRQEKASVRTIHFATRQGKLAAPLYRAMPDYGSLTEIVDHWDYSPDNKLFCYLCKEHAQAWGVPIPDHVADKSIWHEFLRIEQDKVPAASSSFLETKFADLPHGLPERYAVVVPYTPSNNERHQSVRNYQPRDWIDTLKWLRHHGMKGVVVNAPCDRPVPKDSGLIDLTGRTTLPEAIEVAKHASAYCGIDSWASVLCGLHLASDRMAVLSRNDHLYRWARRYYPTHRDHAFIARRVQVL